MPLMGRGQGRHRDSVPLLWAVLHTFWWDLKLTMSGDGRMRAGALDLQFKHGSFRFERRSRDNQLLSLRTSPEVIGTVALFLQR